MEYTCKLVFIGVALAQIKFTLWCPHSLECSFFPSQACFPYNVSLSHLASISVSMINQLFLRNIKKRHLHQPSNGTWPLQHFCRYTGEKVAYMFCHFLLALSGWLKDASRANINNFMAQQNLTHPRIDQAFRFRALSSGSKAIAAAATKWVIGIKSECAGLAPVTVDTFHVHLTEEESSSVFLTVTL